MDNECKKEFQKVKDELAELRGLVVGGRIEHVPKPAKVQKPKKAR